MKIIFQTQIMLVSASDQTDMEVVIHKLYIRMENKWRHFAVRRFVKNKHCLFFFLTLCNSQLPGTWSRGVQPASQNPYPI